MRRQFDSFVRARSVHNDGRFVEEWSGAIRGLLRHAAEARTVEFAVQRQSHWDAVYSTRGEEQLSWFEALPSLSLRMMEAAGLTPETCVLDVGGGDSRLVDVLAARGLDCLAVLDVSGAALHRAQARLGARLPFPCGSKQMWPAIGRSSRWTSGTTAPCSSFLTGPEIAIDTAATCTTRSGRRLGDRGNVRPDGPEECSGLPVVRFSADRYLASSAAISSWSRPPHLHIDAVARHAVLPGLSVPANALTAATSSLTLLIALAEDRGVTGTRLFHLGCAVTGDQVVPLKPRDSSSRRSRRRGAGCPPGVSMRIDCNRGSGTWKSAEPGQLVFGPLAVTRPCVLRNPCTTAWSRTWP